MLAISRQFVHSLRRVFGKGLLVLATLSPLQSANSQSPSIELIGVARISGMTLDRATISEKLEDGSVSNQFGGLSALDYTGSGNRFVLLSDRGAGDGAVSYACRYHEADLVVDAENKTVQLQLIATRFFKSPAGTSLVGSLEAHAKDLAEPSPSNWTAFDPEGLRVNKNGMLSVSDEYGPRVVRVDKQGQIVSEVDIPDAYRFCPAIDGQYTRGIYPNRGMEGIAETPSGQTKVIAIQSPLIQDAVVKNDKCLGLNCRWLLLNQANAPVKQVVYRLENVKTGVSELLALDEHRFLVLERDSEVGAAAQFKRVYLADIENATDVSERDSLPSEAWPPDTSAAKKTLLIDLLDDRYGIGGERTAEKPEGLSWGKPLPDGRRTLWICCDNDFDAEVASEIYCFAIGNL